MNPMDINDRVAAYRGNPQALQQRYAMSQDLLDLMALQQVTKEKQDAARQMQLQAAQQGTPPTISQQLETEAVDLTKQQMMGHAQTQGILGLQAAQQSTPPAPAAQGLGSMPPKQFAEGGSVWDDLPLVGPLVRMHSKVRKASGGAEPESTATPSQSRAVDPTTAERDQAAPTRTASEPKRATPSAAAAAAAARARGAQPERQSAKEAPVGLDALSDAYLRSALTQDPEAARAAAQARYDTEFGTRANEAYARRQGQHGEGLAALREAQQGKLDSMQSKDSRPEWLQRISAMANAYDARRGPAGLAGMAAINAGTDNYAAAQEKRAQDLAQAKLDYASEVNKYIQAGWPLEDAQLAVAQKRYETGSQGAAGAAESAGAAAKSVQSMRERQMVIDAQLKSARISASARGGQDGRGDTASIINNIKLRLNGLKAEADGLKNLHTPKDVARKAEITQEQQQLNAYIASLLPSGAYVGASNVAGAQGPAGVNLQDFPIVGRTPNVQK